jgi:hypothetical protein
MAMQKVNESSGFADGEIFKFETAGDTVEGYLIGKTKIQFAEDEPARNKYIVKTSSGVVNFVGSKKLDDALPAIENGTRVRIKYTKKEKLKGGKTIKLFDIEYDPSDVIAVA